ncbi:hypothetical protein OPV22_022781 [Ensete ventricosum]|uniref:Uncharacterized protein n=1 Tax=Ensete ventricosum TaxID=4639 RepID=A0AAV8QQC0_ENSVE|nr:hypothetical protein OPV22_022781 [Ensete ventricosum]
MLSPFCFRSLHFLRGSNSSPSRPIPLGSPNAVSRRGTVAGYYLQLLEELGIPTDWIAGLVLELGFFLVCRLLSWSRNETWR